MPGALRAVQVVEDGEDLLLRVVLGQGRLRESRLGGAEKRSGQSQQDKQSGSQKEYALRLADLLRRGDSDANVLLQPGDVIIIPESAF